MKTSSRPNPTVLRTGSMLATLLLAGLLALAPHAVAADATLAEMLELAVYSEETKGDLPAAIKLYEQIVDEAEANQAVAAQAQFRLATCLHKQGDYSRATAAFETLVRDYPGQKDLVSLAKEYLAAGPDLAPAPWQHGEEAQYAIRLGAGTRVGLARRTAHADVIDGRKVWRFQWQARARAQEWSRVVVDAITNKPIQCQWKISVIGESFTTYGDTTAETTIRGQEGTKQTELDGAIYDNEQATFLLRQLPLADGYETVLKIHTGISGGAIIEVPLRVTGPAPITVPAGTFDCLKVTLKVGPTEQVLYYATDERRTLVRMEANAAVLELLRVINVAEAQPVTYRDEDFGFTLTAPAGWMMERMNPTDPHESNVMILDPEGKGTSQISIEDVERFPAEVGTSARAWADYKVAQIRRHVSRIDYTDDSWGETTIDGQPAITLVAEFVQPPLPAPHQLYGVYSLIDDKTAELWCATLPEDFEEFRPKFEAVIQTYRAH